MIRPALLSLALLCCAAAPANILVAARPIARGTVIAPADVVLAATHALVLDALVDPAQAVGLTARRAIAVGVSVRMDALAASPVVRRGDPVTLRIERPGFSVEATGAASADAAQGESVAAVNAVTGTHLRGAATSAGIVSIQALKGDGTGRHSNW